MFDACATSWARAAPGCDHEEAAHVVAEPRGAGRRTAAASSSAEIARVVSTSTGPTSPRPSPATRTRAQQRAARHAGCGRPRRGHAAASRRARPARARRRGPRPPEPRCCARPRPAARCTPTTKGPSASRSCSTRGPDGLGVGSPSGVAPSGPAVVAVEAHPERGWQRPADRDRRDAVAQAHVGPRSGPPRRCRAVGHERGVARLEHDRPGEQSTAPSPVLVVGAGLDGDRHDVHEHHPVAHQVGGGRVSARAPRGPAHIRTRVPPARWCRPSPPRRPDGRPASSAQSRCARGEAPATRAVTPGRPRRAGRAPASCSSSPRRGRRGAGGCGRGLATPPPSATDRRRPRRRRRRPPVPPRRRAPPSGGAPAGAARRPAPRHPAGRPARPCSRSSASSRSRSSAHSAGSHPAAARAAVCAPRSRRRTEARASRTAAPASRAGRRPGPGPGPTRWRRASTARSRRCGAPQHRQQRGDDRSSDAASVAPGAGSSGPGRAAVAAPAPRSAWPAAASEPRRARPGGRRHPAIPSSSRCAHCPCRSASASVVTRRADGPSRVTRCATGSSSPQRAIDEVAEVLLDGDRHLTPPASMRPEVEEVAARCAAPRRRSGARRRHGARAGTPPRRRR